MYIYIYISRFHFYLCVHVYIYVYIYIHVFNMFIYIFLYWYLCYVCGCMPVRIYLVLCRLVFVLLLVFDCVYFSVLCLLFHFDVGFVFIVWIGFGFILCFDMSVLTCFAYDRIHGLPCLWFYVNIFSFLYFNFDLVFVTICIQR